MKRRTVLSAAGVGLLGSMVSGGGSAKMAGSEAEVQTQMAPFSEEADTHFIIEHIDTGDEFVFDTLDEVDTDALPSGEYRREHHQQVNGTSVIDTDRFTLEEVVEPASEAELAIELDADRGIDPTGSLPVWVSATTGAGENISGAVDETIELEITDEDNETVFEDSTTTDADGLAFVDVDLDLVDGDYSLTVEWPAEGLSAFRSFETGPLIEFGFLSGPGGVGNEVGVPVSRTLEDDPEPGTIELELERPDDTTDTLSVDINNGGVGIAEFVPEQPGQHSLTRPDSFRGRSFMIRDRRLYTEGFRLRDQRVDEPIVFGGFVLDDAVTPVSNESIEVELRERFGEQVFDTVNASTDGSGRFTVSFDPLSEADSYGVAVRTADGEEIGDERIRLNELEEVDPQPDVSVSFDQFRAVPGEGVTATIELTDASGEPVAGDITLVERISFRGPVLGIDSVSTGSGGTAEYETTIPERFIEGGRFRLEAIATVDNETVNTTRSIGVSSVDVDLEFGQVQSGSTVERELTVTERDTGTPVSGADVGMILSRGHDARGGGIEADHGTTGADGDVNFEFDVPADVRQRVQFNAVFRPHDQINRRFISRIAPFTPTVETVNEVAPGGSFTVTYSVDSNGADTIGMVFIEKSNAAQVAVIDPGEPVSVDVPARMAGESIRLRTVVIDEDAHLVNEFDSVFVSDEVPDTDVTAVFDFDPETPEVDEEVTFDAGDSTATETTIDSYEWDFTEDGETDAEGEEASFTFESEGETDVTLTITGEDGATDSTTETVVVVTDEAPEPPDEWTEAGLTDEQFGAVDRANDGTLSRGDVRNAIQEFITEDSVNGVAFTRAEIRSVVEVFIQT